MRIVRSCGVSTIAACLNVTRKEGISGGLLGDRPNAITSSETLEFQSDDGFPEEIDILQGEKG
ncbi:hypothetical protein [[Limnothrix rosea] IAM M-220]|uniref:hypothetical protein n=1 Tax=[Limnothrix rosea] IAM M-220 TaxID=454133 RepID=UPI000967C297|nr:hypothetical protein [[Limnothrix rosea] IAM M-220]OKH19371.1 hypothetical protein NIES208_02320 [[Limnothrix rosea] IAM M-220]